MNGRISLVEQGVITKLTNYILLICRVVHKR